MSPTDKRARNNNPRAYASGKDRYKNQDKHRWRKVLVWLISALFSVLLTLAVITHGSWSVWLSVSTAITGVVYALFLLEWYVWKTNLARNRARVVSGIISLVLIIAGFTWQRRLPKSIPRFPAAVEMVMGTSKRDMNAVYWFEIGGTIFPAHTALYLRFVNNGPPAMIDSYTVEALNSAGNWVRLIRIPDLGGAFGAFYWVPDGKFSEAARWEATSIDPQLIDKVIPSHDVVRGWAYFELPEDIDIEPGAKLRIHIRDVMGDESSQEVRAEEGMHEVGSVHVLPMGASNEKTDLSRYEKRYWSENKEPSTPAP
jgi:hypothetical protein